MKVKSVKIDGKKLGYFDVGRGSPILMLHGLSACKESFIPVINELKDNYRVIAIDLPGHRDSEELDCLHNLESYSDFLFKFIKKLKIKKISLFGTSIGASIALQFSLSYPNQVNKLIVQSPIFNYKQLKTSKVVPFYFKYAIFFPVIKFFSKFDFFREYFFFKYTNRLIQNKIPQVANNMQREDRELIKSVGYDVINAHLNHSSIDAWVESGFSLLEVDLIDSLKRVSAKTLILWGENDEFLSMKWGSILNKLIVVSKLVKIKKSSHFMIMEKPKKVAGIVRRFLK